MPSQDFVIKGIPTCLLVHKGKILWRGHPFERKLAEDINALIYGTEVSFESAKSEAAAEEPSSHVPSEEISAKLSSAHELLAAFNQTTSDAKPLSLTCN